MRIVRDAAQPHVRLSEVFPTCVWTDGDWFMVAEFGVEVGDALTMTGEEFVDYLSFRGWSPKGVAEVYLNIGELNGVKA
jgi:hypothetical protein